MSTCKNPESRSRRGTKPQQPKPTGRDCRLKTYIQRLYQGKMYSLKDELLEKDVDLSSTRVPHGEVIVNAGNGSRGFFIWDVLDKLVVDTSGSLNLKPDVLFLNHIPNPEDKIAMSITRVAVLNHSANLGMVFDTDADRSGVVHSAGNAINGDRLVTLMLAIVFREHPETMIVSDARTSMALTQFITDRGGHHCLYHIGYRNVIDKEPQLNREGIEIHLMMETMGLGH
ncbi:hypothetical protein GIB67_034376 [Kingdonia uniflora]|uniref:Alpha-D-phosphohexomutase alpha/beta/alpha domain-containing protein n=1 Tax=Kingdonia uniflora TaxID=39325 RepID=A0A7J7NSM5_9MAGN|nr:hypothetical protein GIB67_034376 [Kingdonia uniflora]